MKIKLHFIRPKGYDGALRVFECRNCEHMIRLGSSHCGSCFDRAPLLNHKVWIFVTLFCLLAFVLRLWLTLPFY